MQPVVHYSRFSWYQKDRTDHSLRYLATSSRRAVSSVIEGSATVALEVMCQQFGGLAKIAKECAVDMDGSNADEDRFSSSTLA